MGNIASFSAARAERSGDHRSSTAEQALLAVILQVNEAYSLAAQHCGPEDFDDGFHGRMFAAMGGLLGQGKKIDALSLYFAMDSDAALEPAEKRKYFVDLSLLAVGRLPSMVVDYAVAIRKFAGQRKLKAMAEDLLSNPASMLKPVPEMAEQLHRLMMTQATNEKVGARHLADISIVAIEQAETAYKAGGAITGVPTGLIDLDAVLGGLAKSDLCIIGGRPSMGKTVLGVNIGINAAKAGHKTAVFSLEMSGEQLAMRFLAGETGVTTDAMRRGSLCDYDFDRLNQSVHRTREMPLFIDDRPALTVAEIRAAAEDIQRQHGLDLIVIDYLGLVRPDKQRESRVVDITDVSAGLKGIAKHFNVPVVCLAQLSRQVEQRDDKRPMLSDLRDSGAIEQDADQVIFVYREEYYLSRSEPDLYDKRREQWESRLANAKGIAELIVAKNRHGRIDNVQVRFDADRQRFENLQRGHR